CHVPRPLGAAPRGARPRRVARLQEDRARVRRDVQDGWSDIRRPARRRDRTHGGPDDPARAHPRADRGRADALMRSLLSSVLAIVVLTAVFGFGYPALMPGFASAAFPHQAGGSLVHRDG